MGLVGQLSLRIDKRVGIWLNAFRAATSSILFAAFELRCRQLCPMPRARENTVLRRKVATDAWSRANYRRTGSASDEEEIEHN